MERSRYLSPGILRGALVALIVAGCGDPMPSELPEPGKPLFSSSGPVLVECPTDVTKSVTDTLDLLGGTISVDGHSIALPTGAVLLPTEFSLTVPAGQYVELNIRAGGAEAFEFEAPVSVTLSYERCTRSNIDKGPLSVWKVDPVTKALLREMGGTDDKVARTITFSTDSLSSYAFAN